MHSLINDLIDDSQTGRAIEEVAAEATPKTVPGRGGETLEPGSKLGAYEVKRWLGAGGTGDVYLAEHVHLGRRVAIKRLRPDAARDRKALRRFFDEARAVNRIRHRNIVEITDLAADEHDVYCVMEMLDGTTLAALEYSGGMRLSRALDIAIQICDALAEVHAAGIVHRDLKPQNVMLVEHRGQGDRVKLLDFGIAKLRDNDRRLSGDSTTGNVALGTPGYMAPEQLLGGHVDHRADLYALGVILYQMATGSTPFVADTWGQAVVKHATEVPARPSRLPGAGRKLPAALEDLILCCLEKTPEKRPKSAVEVGDALKRLRDGDSSSIARRRLLVPLAIAIVTFAIVSGLLAFWPTRPGGEQAPAPSRSGNTNEPSSERLIAGQPAGTRPATTEAGSAPSNERRPRPATAGGKTPEAAIRAAGRPIVLQRAQADAPGPASVDAPGEPPEAAPSLTSAANPGLTSADAPGPATASPAEMHYAAGRELLRQGKALLAVKRLEACVAADPHYARAYRLLGKAHAMLGRKASAIAAFEEFLRLEPSYRDAATLRRVIADFHERTPSPSADGTKP